MTLRDINAPRPYFQGITQTITPDAATAILAAMKTVATHAGEQPLSAIAIDMLSATRDQLFSLELDLEALASISPQQLAAHLPDQRQRELAIQLMILMPYLPITIAPQAVAQVDAFATELGVAPVNLKVLHQVRHGQFGQLVLGYTQRTLAYLAPQNWWKQLHALYKFGRQYYGVKPVAQRFQALADYPADSLGHAYYQFCRDRNFPLPGEKGSFSELLVPHDLLHLLSNIGTDAAGEITAAGFEAGLCSNPEQGFEFLLEVILDFHLGIEYTTMGFLEPSTGQFQPQAVMAAFRRGTQVTQDLLHESWDFWADMDQPLATVRHRYGLTPSSQPAEPVKQRVLSAS